MALEDANPIKGVSGPGKYAKRLDRIPANFYGDQKQTGELASGAPLAKTPDVKPQALPQVAPAQVTPLFAPSERPNEPVTSGVDIGPGPGSEIVNLPNTEPTASTVLRKIAQFDNSGEAELAISYLSDYGF